MATTGHESEAINVAGLKASLQKLKTDHIDGKADEATTLAGYGITDAYTKTEVNGLVDTPHQNYVTVAATSQTTAATDVLPASGQAANTIYRVSNWDGSANSGAGAFDATCYSEYAWDDVSNPNKYVFLCVKSQIGEVFDISVYNNNAKYADLAAALNGGANIPQSLQKGGMSVKFVCSSDNKYVQYLYVGTSTAVADFTNTDNWEKMNLEEEISQSEQRQLEKISSIALDAGTIFNYSFIGRGIYQESQLLFSGLVGNFKTIHYNLSQISVSEQGGDPRYFIRVYDINKTRLSNLIISSYGDYNFPDGAYSYELLIFLSVVGSSISGAIYSGNVSYNFDNNLNSKIELASIPFNLLRKEEYTPDVSLIQENYYITYPSGNKLSANNMNMISPIHLKAGETLIVNCSGQNDTGVSIISETNQAGDSFKPIFEGRRKVENYIYYAVKDCYIAVSYYIGYSISLWKVSDNSLHSIYKEIETINSNLNTLNLDVKKVNRGVFKEVSITGTGAVQQYELVLSDNFDSNSNYVNIECYFTVSQDYVNSPAFYLRTYNQNGERLQNTSISIGKNYIPKYSGAVRFEVYFYCTVVGASEVGATYIGKARSWQEDDLYNVIINESSSLYLNIGVDGDSITAGGQWAEYACEKLKSNLYNVAYGSSCWSYKRMFGIDGTTQIVPQLYTDPNFSGFGGPSDLTTDVNRQRFVNNNACTHIEMFISLVQNSTYPIPDIFIFAMGTNYDTGYDNSDGSVEEAMTPIDISPENFVDGNGNSLKYTMCGAMRWCIQTIKEQYPNCKVFVSLPIQRARYTANESYLYPKVELIKEMAIQMGCQIIDQYKGCGITSAIEKDESPFGPYLRDGLHPNIAGQKLMGAFAAKQIANKYFEVD